MKKRAGAWEELSAVAVITNGSLNSDEINQEPLGLNVFLVKKLLVKLNWQLPLPTLWLLPTMLQVW
jgi:hypothetical protein